jgi:hypothetical protein
VFTPFHKPPYPYPYGRSVDETTTVVVVLVNIQTPRVGLSWGHGHWRNPGRDDALRSAHRRTLQTYDVLMFGALVRR